MNKKSIIIGACGLVIGFAIGAIVFGASIKYKHMIEITRNECIEFNKDHNKVYDAIVRNYIIYGGEKYRLAASILQNDFSHIIAINKALGIDCYDYNENGEVIMVEHENGELHPVEKLPEELRIIK